MPQGKGTPDEVKNEVRKLLFKDPDLTAKELKSEVEKVFVDLDSTERTYSNLKNELLPDVLKVKTGILEREWNLGILSLYDGMPRIPPEAIPQIDKIQSISIYKVTLRQARWISFLFPLIKNNEMLRDISFYYAYFEAVADMSVKSFETAEYDKYLRDIKKQKELFTIFQSKVSSLDWRTQKNILFKQTGTTLREPISTVLLKGDKAFGIREFESDVAIGEREHWYTLLKKQKAIVKSYTLPDGDMLLTLNLPITFTQGYEQQHRVPDMIKKEGEVNG